MGSFKLSDVPFIQADLNEPFAFGRRFDCIVASEIIEHLENPRHFLRECAKVADVVVITSPNTDSPASKWASPEIRDLNHGRLRGRFERRLKLIWCPVTDARV